MVSIEILRWRHIPSSTTPTEADRDWDVILRATHHLTNQSQVWLVLGCSCYTPSHTVLVDFVSHSIPIPIKTIHLISVPWWVVACGNRGSKWISICPVGPILDAMLGNLNPRHMHCALYLQFLISHLFIQKNFPLSIENCRYYSINRAGAIFLAHRVFIIRSCSHFFAYIFSKKFPRSPCRSAARRNLLLMKCEDNMKVENPSYLLFRCHNNSRLQMFQIEDTRMSTNSLK